MTENGVASTMTTVALPAAPMEPAGLRYEVLELAMMLTSSATRDRGLRILELGTDVDPRTRAVLRSRIGKGGGRLVSVSESAEVTDAARERCTRRVAYHTGRLAVGWPDHAPYDLVVCLTLMNEIPHAWLNQLVPGGRVLAAVRLTEPAHQIGLICIDLGHEGLLDWPQRLLVANLTRSGLHQWSSAGVRLASTRDAYTVARTPNHCPRRPTSAFPEIWVEDPGNARWMRTIDPTEPAHLAVTEHPTAGIAWNGLCDRAFNPANEAPEHPRCSRCVKRLNRHLDIGGTRR